ncbi:alpha/beta hydrolase [Rhodococcus sp. X156]|uniref:alpha/beta hydrolase n=1 Tax=Rhodococcus sp. X156 TaxID=2499145 RepID=UPI000FDBEFEC|nr:alpha/beta hydrolase [Rhodococcus sp. X156]
MSMDPQLAEIFAALTLPEIGGDGADPRRLREMMEQVSAMVPVSIEVDHVEDADADGVPVRVYRPASEHPLPVVLFLHGGGFVLGSVRTHDALARRIVRDCGAVVVSVDYRLAPEHPFPAAVEDCWTALQWAAAHAAELGGDPERLAVAGDSAGGNLAAVLTHLARDSGGPALAFQLLLYPVTSGHQDWPSMIENAEAPLLNRKAIAYFAAQYAGAAGEVSVRSAPATAESFAGLPPAFVATAGHDPLRDDGEAYGELLRRDGVPVTVRRFEPLVHGFASLDGVTPSTTAAVDECLAALRAGLHPGEPAQAR